MLEPNAGRVRKEYVGTIISSPLLLYMANFVGWVQTPTLPGA